MLSILIWLPIAGAMLIGFGPGERLAKNARTVALAIASLLLVWSLILLTQFNPTLSGTQMPELLPWIESLGLSYRLGVDGLSLPLLILNSILTWIVIYSSERLNRARLFYALVLLVAGGMAGAFLAQNLLLFVLFYEIELIPIYLMIAIWGGARRDYAAIKFLIYTSLSGIILLGGFLALAWASGDFITFDYETLKAQAQTLPLGTQLILLAVLLLGFAIKAPFIPFHTWLPDTYVEASPPVAILLGGVLAKLGTYGLFRFCLGLLPEAWSVVSSWLAIWAAITVLYGAIAAIAQKDIKRMVAYSSIGHMGYVLLAAAAATPLSLIGGIAQMFSHGIILAALFYLVGVIETKVGTRELDVLNGLLNPIRGLPLISSLLVFAGMASAGIPGMVGFISEFLVFQGSFSAFPWPTIVCIIGTGLTAVYFVILLNRTCFGRLDNKTAYYPIVTTAERAPALILAGLILFLGIQPTWLVRWSEQTSTALVAQLNGELIQTIALEPEGSDLKTSDRPLVPSIANPSP